MLPRLDNTGPVFYSYIYLKSESMKKDVAYVMRYIAPDIGNMNYSYE